MILHYELLRSATQPDRTANRHPLLVFIHGIAGSAASWGTPFRSLCSHADILLVDALGFGRSPKPDCAYTPEDHVHALADTLNAVLSEKDSTGVSQRDRPVYLIGHSMGALLAAWWAKTWPDSRTPARVILISLPVFESEADAIQRVGASSLFNRWMALETPLARAGCWLMCHIRPWLMPLMPRFLPDLPPAVARDSLLHTWQSYSKSLREVVLRSQGRWLMGELTARQIPLTLIHGRTDSLAPAESVCGLGEAGHESGSDINLYWIDGAHDIVFTHAEEIADRIRKTLEDLSPADRPH